jgi:hypothetical protein
MKQKMVGLLFGALVACGLYWYTTHRDELALEAWSQENGLHIKAVHWTWRWEGGPFHLDWTGHSPLPRGWKGNVYRFEAVRDGETASHVYWAVITRWRGEMEVAVETPAQRYVRVGTGHFPREAF